jgi:hypothetical protein
MGCLASDLDGLTGCPNLRELTLVDVNGSHQDFAHLSKLRSLTSLDMPDLQYRADLVADLHSLPVLKAMHVVSWSESQVAQLRHDMPNLAVVREAQ